ncbi:hypothetical protein FDF74_12100 [Clostridium niameyense]|uniref:DUF4365 domain-containing protein n=1 Tax=Clostridium niameyense TaxID=1622073 RepID=A0A6M0RCN4_9CLOT|nr:hypothetical protein [Clostridium niameyense]NEZ47923.1 hypothetical protein [Clostridium niameyense]
MNTGIIGEYYVLCELWRKGFNALKADNPNQKDWDILVLLNNKNIKLQVKTIDWQKSSSKVITGNFKNGFDFLALVLLNYNKRKYTVLVIPKSKIKVRSKSQPRGLLDKENNILYTNKTITIGELEKNTKLINEYEDEWSQIN